MAPEYNTMELMICVAARNLEDGKTVAVGTGAPCAAAMLSQKTCSPNLVILFEAGGVAPMLPSMPISVGDSRTFYKAIMAAGMYEMMTTCARGQVDYSFLGGAQIDKYGNINSTMVGSDYTHPKVRFPGSGGANDFASLCWRTMIMTVHSKDRFVEKCDFITSPGFLTGGNAREVAGLPEGGPHMIITDLAVMTFHPESKAMMLASLNPGVEVEQVKENTGFELIIPDTIGRTEAPTEAELRILREEVDPLKVVIGR
jgi:glutaconate CoA-transferase, subunit B